jgi:actin-related protein
MPSFGGDQITALVFDLGSSLSRAGFAGLDQPSVVIPSAVGRRKEGIVVGDMTGKPLRDMEIVQPFSDGIVSDWDALEQQWEYCNTLLGVDASEHALMYSEPSFNPKEQREQLCQLAFEKFNVPGFYLGRSAVLSSFAAGRSTALVVDSGASMTSVVPVFDGYVIKKAIERSPVGGDFVSAQVMAYLDSIKVDTTPHCFIKSKQIVDSTKTPRYQLHQLDGITDSFKMFAKMVCLLRCNSRRSNTATHPHIQGSCLSHC